MSQLEIGDRVKVSEFTAEVTFVSRNSTPPFLQMRDHEGGKQQIILTDAMKVTKVEPLRPEGQIIRDADNDVFIWEPGVNPDRPWRLVWSPPTSHWGRVDSRHEDDVPALPLTVLSGE